MSSSFTDVHPADPATVITYDFNPGLSVPTTMSWAGQSTTSLENGTGTAPASQFQLDSASGHATTDPPPDYEHLFIPTRSLIYSYLMTDNDAMLLIPPSDAPDTRPVYHISVSVNPFMPSMNTTTIRKGTADGEWVASLEWGPNHLTPLLSIGSVSRTHSSVLSKISRGTSEHDYKWDWNGGQDHKMYWTCDRHMYKCYLLKDSSRPNVGKELPLAEFSGRTTISESSRRRSRPPITLKIRPDGHVGPRMIYIVLAALMIERRREGH